MKSRRDFLRRCALLAAGAVAVDQLELLERLSHSKVFTTGGWSRSGGYVRLNKRYTFTGVGPLDADRSEWIRRQINYQASKSAVLIMQRIHGL